MSDEQKRNLALDALQKIKFAEAEAKKIVQEAREKTSVKIVEDAHKDAEEIRERVLVNARNRAIEKKKSIIQEAQVEVKKIGEKTRAEIERLRNISADTRSRAIEKVAESIRKTIRGGHL